MSPTWEADRAFEWLERAVKYRDTAVGGIPFDPFLKSLHSDPRWLPLLRRLGKAPEQLAAIKFDGAEMRSCIRR